MSPQPDMHVRLCGPADFSATRDLVRQAFADNEPDETAVFLDALRADDCLIGEWLIEDAKGVVAHVAFSRVFIEQADGARMSAAMLTPLAVRPDRQKQGFGQRLTRAALASLESRGEIIFLVLGHPEYYPRFGFSHAAAQNIESRWSGRPGFMARSSVPVAGKLILPHAIDSAH